MLPGWRKNASPSGGRRGPAEGAGGRWPAPRREERGHADRIPPESRKPQEAGPLRRSRARLKIFGSQQAIPIKLPRSVEGDRAIPGGSPRRKIQNAVLGYGRFGVLPRIPGRAKASKERGRRKAARSALWACTSQRTMCLAFGVAVALFRHFAESAANASAAGGHQAIAAKIYARCEQRVNRRASPTKSAAGVAQRGPGRVASALSVSKRAPGATRRQSKRKGTEKSRISP